MGNAIADSTPWRRRITLYSWPSAAASSLLMGSVTLISALCSTQLKQPKPTSWRSDAGVEPLLRHFALLRAHGLLRKLPRTHRYQLTAKGRRIITALLAACYADVEQLTKIAA